MDVNIHSQSPLREFVTQQIKRAHQLFPRKSYQLTFGMNENTQIKGGLHLVFEDDRPGVQTENLPKLFDHFFREDLARTSDGEKRGHRLGLAICQKIISRHGGHIFCPPRGFRASFGHQDRPAFLKTVGAATKFGRQRNPAMDKKLFIFNNLKSMPFF